MPRKPAKHPRLVDRDYEIIQHLLRYRLTTREVLHRLFFSDSELNAVTKVTSRLDQHGFINKHELYPSRSYFTLGKEGARLVGLSPRKCKPLGGQALPTEFGTLMFCCGAAEQRERLLVSDILARNPDLVHRHIDSSHYYLDHDGQSVRLGYIRVDLGGPPDHVARKCEKDIGRRYQIPAFRDLIDGDRFMISVITASEEKKGFIRQSLMPRGWRTRFRVEVVGELSQLIAGSQPF